MVKSRVFRSASVLLVDGILNPSPWPSPLEWAREARFSAARCCLRSAKARVEAEVRFSGIEVGLSTPVRVRASALCARLVPPLILLLGFFQVRRSSARRADSSGVMPNLFGRVCGCLPSCGLAVRDDRWGDLNRNLAQRSQSPQRGPTFLIFHL